MPSRGVDIVEKGYPKCGIPRLFPVPYRHSRDLERFVPEASKFGLFPPDLGDGSNKLQFGCHPVTGFFRSVLVDALQLVFTVVAVPHSVLLLRRGSLMVN